MGSITRARAGAGLALAMSLCACAVSGEASSELGAQGSVPRLWLEAEPTPDPNLDWALVMWAGVWTEYLEGRPGCQDRFTLRPSFDGLRVSTHDCSTNLPYDVEGLRWDGQVLDFIAVSAEGLEIPYRVALEGHERISGRAGDEAVFWTRTGELEEAEL